MPCWYALRLVPDTRSSYQRTPTLDVFLFVPTFRMVHHQRLVGAEIPVGKAVHQPVAERIQLLPGFR
ncbi:MAG: hypothetical protein HYX94_00225 [Chloroflexi bacterium]|nr:hypothetical protein [Chloroflexota bacterium]